jgi:aryl-alcohol dehydrogenase-like predicted oxidoreductase
MTPRKLGRTGLAVSPLCLGMMSYGSRQWQPWVLDKPEAKAFVRQALDHGINFFDTADFYSIGQSEEALGEAIRGTVSRDELVLSSKCGLPMGAGPNARGGSRKHIRESIDASLKRIGVDYLDLYLMHVWDGATPVEETVETLQDLVREGKILHFGASNYMTWQLAIAQRAAIADGRRGFATMQLQINLAYREEERDMLPFCEHEGIGVMVFSPLARGWLVNGDAAGASLTERERTRVERDAKAKFLYGSSNDHAVRDRLLEVAARLGLPPGRVALAWVLSRPGISSVLVGALEPRHLDEAVAALEVQLSPADCELLESAYRPGPIKSDALDTVLKPAVR